MLLLDGFDIRSDGQSVHLPLAGQRLVAFLSFHDRALLRVHVAGTLWPDTTEERSAANLRSGLWRVQRSGRGLVDASPDHIALARGVRVDLREAATQARGLLNGSTGSPVARPTCRALSADVLPDWYDEWVIVERERFRQLRLHALESLCAQLAVERRFGEAVEAGLAAVAGEPLRESAHRAVIRAHLAEGNRGEALRQFERYRALLWRELALEPSPEILQLVGPIAP